MDQVRVGRVTVDFSSLVVEGDAGRYSMEPKVLDVLQVLVRNHGEVVSRETLIDQVWGVGFGGDERLSRAISLLRKALGDTRGHHDHIETIAKRGYRLVAPVAGLAKVADAAFDPPEQSIAVLPFVNMSVDPADETCADGIAEELINALSHVPQLLVTGRTSSFAFNGHSKDIREIGAALNVGYVLEGSLRRDGKKVRITAQLIKADNGYHLWSDTFEQTSTNAFELQDRAATEIIEALSLVMHFSRPERIAKRSSTNDEAYSFFLQGRQLTYLAKGQTTIPTAIGLLEKAIELDPNFAEAMSWLALAHTVLGEHSLTTDWKRHYHHGAKALERCLAIDPNIPEAWHTKGTILSRELKLDEAYAAFQRAYELDPNGQKPLIGFGYANSAIGHYDKASELMKKAIVTDPLNGLWYGQLGGIELQRGDMESAERCMNQAYNLGFGPAAFTAAMLLGEREGPNAAIEFAQRCFDGLNWSDKVELSSPLARKLAFNAFYRRARLATWLVTSKLKRRYADSESQPTISSIMGFYFMDQPGNLLDALLRKPNTLPGYVIGRCFEKTSRGKNLRAHPDFAEFAERIGLVRAWQKYGWPDVVKPNPGTDGSNLQISVD
ncbi:winged helix-turn-helix domain-containing tetratricopeptide repeat protein [Erythrobacter sp. MTPC3]|uniref:winged helix-turn-helix domain-containing tetratricopeptide repeat protein n=1 Tax=Erythrobacter sp. MTPC3 TaxID=3056564 RepID=UPI0036F27E8E